MAANTDNPVAKPPVIRAVILDFGEVLCHLPSAENIERLALIFQMDPRTFLPIYLETRAPYDRGDLLPSEYWQKFAEQAGVKVTGEAIEQARQLDLELVESHQRRDGPVGTATSCRGIQDRDSIQHADRHGHARPKQFRVDQPF